MNAEVTFRKLEQDFNMFFEEVLQSMKSIGRSAILAVRAHSVAVVNIDLCHPSAVFILDEFFSVPFVNKQSSHSSGVSARYTYS